MEDITIVQATPADAAELARILTDATSRKVAYGDHAWGAGEWSEVEVMPYIVDGTTYLAYVAGKLAGTVCLQWQADGLWDVGRQDAGFLHRLATASAFQGQGIGGKVVAWAESQAAQQGKSHLRLDCDAANVRLCKYYEKLGFTRVDTKATANPDYVAALYERLVCPAKY